MWLWLPRPHHKNTHSTRGNFRNKTLCESAQVWSGNLVMCHILPSIHPHPWMWGSCSPPKYSRESQAKGRLEHGGRAVWQTSRPGHRCEYCFPHGPRKLPCWEWETLFSMSWAQVGTPPCSSGAKGYKPPKNGNGGKFSLKKGESL